MSATDSELEGEGALPIVSEHSHHFGGRPTFVGLSYH